MIFRNPKNNTIKVEETLLKDIKKIEGITNKSVKEIAKLLDDGWEISCPKKKKILTYKILNCETNEVKKYKPLIKKNGVFLPAEFIKRIGNNVAILWFFNNSKEHRLLLDIDELSELINEYKRDIMEEKLKTKEV